MRHAIVAGAALLALTAAGGVAAQQAGDWVVGAGALGYIPNSSSNPLRTNNPNLPFVPGSGAKVKSTLTLGLNVHYFVTDHVALEGVFGIPPKLKLDGKGTFSGIGRMGSARLYAPALVAKYFFGEPKARFRPSVGVGVTYNSFKHIRLTQGLQQGVGGIVSQLSGGQIPANAAVTSAHISGRWAPVLTAGASYAIDKHWGISGSLSYVPYRIKAKLTTRVGGQEVVKSSAKIKINALVPYVYLTYRF